MKNSNLLVGFLAGAAVGALAGILFAPDKGSATRKKIATKTGDISDSVKSSFNNFIDGVKEKYSETKNNVEEFEEKLKSGIGKNDGKPSFS